LTASPHRATLQENEGETLRQSELEAILKDHKLWNQSGGKQGKRANLQGANLQDANLESVDLYGANLESVDLYGANLESVDLYGANLHFVNLRDANLDGANLVGANLQDANLQDANLQDADLYGANLRDAKFTTNFKKVRWFCGATFSEDQLPWVVLNPKYPQWAHTLKWVKAKAEAA